MKIASLFLVVTACLFVFFSCKKDSTSRRSILTNGKWQVVRLTEYKDNVLEYNITPDSMQLCNRDDFYLLSADSIYTLDAGAVKCSSFELQVDTLGNWSLSSDEKQIHLDVETYEIVTLTSSSLTMATSYTTGSSVFKDTTIMNNIK
jgi:hypothetical protein